MPQLIYVWPPATASNSTPANSPEVVVAEPWIVLVRRDVEIGGSNGILAALLECPLIHSSHWLVLFVRTALQMTVRLCMFFDKPYYCKIAGCAPVLGHCLYGPGPTHAVF